MTHDGESHGPQMVECLGTEQNRWAKYAVLKKLASNQPCTWWKLLIKRRLGGDSGFGEKTTGTLSASLLDWRGGLIWEDKKFVGSEGKY